MKKVIGITISVATTFTLYVAITASAKSVATPPTQVPFENSLNFMHHSPGSNTNLHRRARIADKSAIEKPSDDFKMLKKA
ncbi:MAG: hypothetical protein CME64_00925 [Halobacteriovoraceae bacterium]|nr:hypothetical protein [Halobacteriovoraceae bacterium]